MNKTEILNKMLDKEWMYNTNIYLFKSTSSENEYPLILTTDKKEFEFGSEFELKLFIEECLPVEKPTKAIVSIPSTQSNEVMAKLKGTIMESIELIKKDKAYIPQAIAISKQVQTLVNLTNLEMNIHKLQNK